MGSDLTAQNYRVSQSQSGTKLENRTPTTFLKLPKIITDESTLMRKILSVMQCIATRFEQEDFKIYVNIQELLLKSFASEPCDTELAELVKMYSEYFDSFQLKRQLLLSP